MKNARIIEFDYTNLITSSDLIFIVWFTIGFDKAVSRHVQCICLARLLQNTFLNLGAMVTKTPENLCVRNH